VIHGTPVGLLRYELSQVRLSTCCRVGRDHIEPTGERLSRPARTYNAATNYRDAPYVKSHVIVSLKLVSASYNW
jgi:hypothetical protein